MVQYKKLLKVFEMVGIEELFSRPCLYAMESMLVHRTSLTRVAKMVLDISTTAGLCECLLKDKVFWSICS